MKKININSYLPFYNKLNEEEKSLLQKALLYKKFNKGQLISSSDNKCQGMLIVEKGDISISTISDEGREIKLFNIKDGDICVTTAKCVIAKLKIEPLIIALEETEAIVIPSVVIDMLSKNNIYFKAYIYELLLERYLAVVLALQDIILKPFRHRLASYLYNKYQMHSDVEISITHEKIAAEINSAREVVTRGLKQLALEGIIELKRGKIIIKNIKALKNL